MPLARSSGLGLGLGLGLATLTLTHTLTLTLSLILTSMPLARSSLRIASAVVKSFRRFASTQRSSRSSTLGLGLGSGPRLGFEG